ncbi:hypothetical protein ACFLVS_03655, partial [Chloroflexota bacterium]
AGYYYSYFRRCQHEGLISTLIVRIQDFIWKIALLYAAMDFSKVIRAEHVETAIGVADFLESSVVEVFRSFGDTRRRKVEMRVLDYIRRAGMPVDYRLIYRNLNLSAKELESCIEPLVKLGLIKDYYRGGTSGRSARILELLQ